MARKIFRKGVKLAQYNKLSNHYINIDSLKNIHPQKFWKKLRSLKSSTTRLFTINNKNNKTDITTEFAAHFDNILNTPRIQKQDKTTFDPTDTNNDAPLFISTSDIKKAIKSLNLGKSRDPFNLLAEHLHLANDNNDFNKWMTDFLNNLFQTGIAPKALSTSLIVPLVKSYKKSLQDPNNYRGISLIPIVTKLLETIILQKCSITQSHNTQYGFKNQSSTLHAEFIVQKTIKHYNNNGSPVYICSLDAEKAFDSCDWSSLFIKLSKDKQLPGSVIKVLFNLYQNVSACVMYLGEKSKDFKLTQGVRQGSILSPIISII